MTDSGLGHADVTHPPVRIDQQQAFEAQGIARNGAQVSIDGSGGDQLRLFQDFRDLVEFAMRLDQKKFGVAANLVRQARTGVACLDLQVFAPQVVDDDAENQHRHTRQQDEIGAHRLAQRGKQAHVPSTFRNTPSTMRVRNKGRSISP